MIAPRDLFVALGEDLEVGLKRAYSLVAFDDQAPTIYHTHGPTVTHDECNTAWITLSVTQPVALESTRCAAAPLATYRVDIVRCWPAVDDYGKVDLELQQAAAQQLQRDAAALWALVTLNYQGELFTVPELGCDAITFRDMRPTGPGGGTAGWTFPIEIAAWGIPLGLGA